MRSVGNQSCMRIHRSSALLFVLMCLLHSAAGADTDVPKIAIYVAKDAHWRADYELARPISRLLFPRSPDTSRVEAWIPTHGFEIAATPEGEVLRRKDGRTFRVASVRVPPVYRMLPKDYAPFSPFGDGGIALYTGRFFACADQCNGKDRWDLELRASKRSHIAVNGTRVIERASWTDSGDGRVVYVGVNEPLETPELIAVIDKALPDSVRAQLLEQLPAFMRHFAAELGALEERPMLFVSYDLSHAPGWGRQGGVLPGQIFIHFYGDHWRDAVKQPNFANDLAWHFAHEAAHLYQQHKYASQQRDWWIHEGAADAFAALALRAMETNVRPFVETRIEQARSTCASQLGSRSLGETIESGAFDAAYTCGLLVNLAIDESVRNAGEPDGLYAVWREYLKLARGAKPDASTYLDAIGRVAPPSVVEHTKKILNAPGPQLLGLTEH